MSKRTADAIAAAVGVVLPPAVVGVLATAWSYRLTPLILWPLSDEWVCILPTFAGSAIGYLFPTASKKSNRFHATVIGGAAVLAFGLAAGYSFFTREPPTIENDHYYEYVALAMYVGAYFALGYFVAYAVRTLRRSLADGAKGGKATAPATKGGPSATKPPAKTEPDPGGAQPSAG